jgi:hypothetical protein
MEEGIARTTVERMEAVYVSLCCGKDHYDTFNKKAHYLKCAHRRCSMVCAEVMPVALMQIS